MLSQLQIRPQRGELYSIARHAPLGFRMSDKVKLPFLDLDGPWVQIEFLVGTAQQSADRGPAGDQHRKSRAATVAARRTPQFLRASGVSVSVG